MAACVALSSRGMLLSGNQELRSWLQYLATAVFATVLGHVVHRTASDANV